MQAGLDFVKKVGTKELEENRQKAALDYCKMIWSKVKGFIQKLIETKKVTEKALIYTDTNNIGKQYAKIYEDSRKNKVAQLSQLRVLLQPLTDKLYEYGISQKLERPNKTQEKGNEKYENGIYTDWAELLTEILDNIDKKLVNIEISDLKDEDREIIEFIKKLESIVATIDKTISEKELTI